MNEDKELQKIMKQNKTVMRIRRMAIKSDVNYDIAKQLFESTLREMLKDKEYWNKFEVRPS